jgi:hypothetical protein
MSDLMFPPMASIEAARPVFTIVMGVSMWLIAWRLSKSAGTWAARLMMAGALLLAGGYAVLLPLYEAGVLKPYSPRHATDATALAWQVVKMVVMNLGWLVFGLGLAIHARVPGPAATRAVITSNRKVSPHESIA